MTTPPVVDVNAYQDLPSGKTWASMAFSGDLVAAPEYLPKGLSAEVLRYGSRSTGAAPSATTS